MGFENEVDKEIVGLKTYPKYSPQYLAQKILLEEDDVDQLYIKYFREDFYQKQIKDIARYIRIPALLSQKLGH
ncbi:MAG: hypothetical protein ABI597_10605 [Gammaproteobacteria bacterium]